jgi:hypothetical protein
MSNTNGNINGNGNADGKALSWLGTGSGGDLVAPPPGPRQRTKQIDLEPEPLLYQPDDPAPPPRRRGTPPRFFGVRSGPQPGVPQQLPESLFLSEFKSLDHPQQEGVVDCDPPLLKVEAVRQPDRFSCGACAAFATGVYFNVGPSTLKEWKEALGTTVERSTHPLVIADYLTGLGLSVEVLDNLTVDDLRRFAQEGRVTITPIQDYTQEVPDKAEFAYGHYLAVVGVIDGGKYVVCADSSADNVLEGEGSDAAPGKVMIESPTFLKQWHDRDIEGNKFIRMGIAVGPPPPQGGGPPPGQTALSGQKALRPDMHKPYPQLVRDREPSSPTYGVRRRNRNQAVPPGTIRPQPRGRAPQSNDDNPLPRALLPADWPRSQIEAQKIRKPIVAAVQRAAGVARKAEAEGWTNPDAVAKVVAAIKADAEAGKKKHRTAEEERQHQDTAKRAIAAVEAAEREAWSHRDAVKKAIASLKAADKSGWSNRDAIDRATAAARDADEGGRTHRDTVAHAFTSIKAAAAARRAEDEKDEKRKQFLKDVLRVGLIAAAGVGVAMWAEEKAKAKARAKARADADATTQTPRDTGKPAAAGAPGPTGPTSPAPAGSAAKVEAVAEAKAKEQADEAARIGQPGPARKQGPARTAARAALIRAEHERLQKEAEEKAPPTPGKILREELRKPSTEEEPTTEGQPEVTPTYRSPLGTRRTKPLGTPPTAPPEEGAAPPAPPAGVAPPAPPATAHPALTEYERAQRQAEEGGHVPAKEPRLPQPPAPRLPTPPRLPTSHLTEKLARLLGVEPTEPAAPVGATPPEEAHQPPQEGVVQPPSPPTSPKKPKSPQDTGEKALRRSYFSECQRDDEGRCLPKGQTGSHHGEDKPSPRTQAKPAAVAKAKELAGKAVALAAKLEHKAKHLIGRQVDRLPDGLPAAVKAVYRLSMLSYSTGYAVATEAAKNRGLPEPTLQRLGQLLAIGDLVGMKATPLVLEALHFGTVTAIGGSFVPVASTAFVGWSLVRNPLKTLRAATAAVDAARKLFARTGSKALDHHGDQADNSEPGYLATRICDTLAELDDQEAAGFMALICVALDMTQDLEKAVQTAEWALESWSNNGDK